CMQALEFPRTF
nr:immunoglobulin light chain junction region [Macaca mulatta]MOV77885.1 immunoglobulin light chain junction region [Macaca mulatta]MOV78513.1 immunoglobulin light chain junction region [Macaca mulatta]MOV78531.1 immunoglobulin light chain junction region [Macaca mulatta]MOV78739.1 immunoglobulin light chain junction region [Macaca mulatta]